MTPAELDQARTRLGLTSDTLAADLGLPPAVVAAWEDGRDAIPSHIAMDLRWRSAIAERRAALEASGLPECAWLRTMDARPEPKRMSDRAARLEEIAAHEDVCPVCLARDQYIADHFPPMPPRPVSAPMRALGWIFRQGDRLPRWAQPAVPTALAFGGYTVLRIFFMLPRMAAHPSLMLTAVAGLVISMTLGATLGALYGLFRAGRERLAARRTA